MIVIIDTGLDAVAAYSCNVGYDLVGAEMRTCQSGGHWDGAEPTCMGKLLICNISCDQSTFTPGLVVTTVTG